MLQSNRIFGLVLSSSLLVLGACSDFSSPDTSASGSSPENLASQTISGSVKGALEAVQSPLVDLNLKRDEIPESLKKISGNPYALPAPLQCTKMRDELKELDVALGPDMQMRPNGKSLVGSDTDYVKEGASMLQGEAIGFVAGKASIIPFRGIVRQITGAARHSKEVATAYESGKLRRAYLKGLSSALKCDRVKTAVTQKKTSKKDLDT